MSSSDDEEDIEIAGMHKVCYYHTLSTFCNLLYTIHWEMLAVENLSEFT